MARLQYEITGENSGLLSAVSAAAAAISKLGNTAEETNVSLQFKNGIAALDNLSKQLLVNQGNVSLFGDSIKNQTQEIGAYQTAINSLLANGFAPMDADVQRLKSRIDDLNTAIKATPKRVTIERNFVPDILPPSFITQDDGTGNVVEKLTAQLKQGTITAQQFADSLAGANTTTALLGKTTQQTAEQVKVADGYLAGLKQNLANLYTRQLNAPEPHLQKLNAEIQGVEADIKQATNIGKEGFDQFGNAIKGVSVQNINGQLVALNNNLFGARLIAKDFVRTLDSNSLAGFAKAVGLLAVDFLYYAQSAQFAVGATATATAAIETETVVAGSGALSIGALGAAFGALLTPLNLIILGVALAGGGLLAYERSQKSAAQAATEHLKTIQAQKQALADYITTLNASQQVQAAASETSASAIVKVNELAFAIKNNTGALFDGKTALREAKDLYPAFYGEIDEASAKTDKFTTATKNLIDALKAAGEFKAAGNLAEESIKIRDKNQVAANAQKTVVEDLTKQYAQLQKLYATPQNGGGGGGTSVGFGLVKLHSDLVDAQTELKVYQDAIKAADAQTQAFYDIANKNAPKAGLVTIKPDKVTTKNVIDPFNEIQDTINGIINKTNELNNSSGLTGYAEEVEKISTGYTTLNQQIEKTLTLIEKNVALGKLTKPEGSALINLLSTGTKSIGINEDSALRQARVKEAQKTADEIQAINDSFAIKAKASQAIEREQAEKLANDKIAAANKGVLSLEEINEKYQSALENANGDNKLIANAINLKVAEVQQAEDASAKVLAIKQGEVIALKAINDKYAQQEEDLYAKIAAINDQATAEQANQDSNEVARINKTFADRIATVKSYFEKLKALQKSGDPIAAQYLATKQAGVIDNLKADQEQQIQLSISKPLIEGIDQAANSFYATLKQINQQTDQSFKAIFHNLTDSLENTFNGVFLNVAEKGLESTLKNAIEHGTSSLFSTTKDANGNVTGSKLSPLGIGVAAGGLAGGLISGATPATSSVGQGAGGLLSGAATGAAVGSLFSPVVGTLVGGLIGGAVGLLGGIFGASKAQKELQEKQLKEQQEQTDLLKASLAYTSTIVGRDTVNGVITNISVGATGQLIATVSGSQLQFVLDRNTKVR